MPPLPYHVYMDLDVVNNDFASQAPLPLRFEEIRDAPFLDGDSADYFCSVIRFTLQTGNSLPVFIPRIDTRAADPVNTTIYKISFLLHRSQPHFSCDQDGAPSEGQHHAQQRPGRNQSCTPALVDTWLRLRRDLARTLAVWKLVPA